MNRKSSDLLKLVIGFVIVCIGLSGLSAHIFSPRRRRFLISKPMWLYSLMVATSFAVLYGKQIVHDVTTEQFDLMNAEKLYEYTNIAAAILSYAITLCMVRPLTAFLNSIELLDTIAFIEIDARKVRQAACLVVLKVVVIPLTIELTLLLRQWQNDPERHLVWTLYTLFPSVIANLMPNCLFGALVLSTQLIYGLNGRLQAIVGEANCLQSKLQMQLQKPYYRMQRFCAMADKLDMLAIKYTVICAQTMDYVQLMATPFIGVLLCNVFGITAGCFAQYYAMAEALINRQDYDIFNALTNAVFLVTSCAEIILQANMCNNSLMAVSETGHKLKCIKLVHADVRFKQSVEAFSLRILVKKFYIQPLGLLQINVSLVQDVISAVTTFLLILIQSDLSLRFALK